MKRVEKVVFGEIGGWVREEEATRTNLSTKELTAAQRIPP